MAKNSKNIFTYDSYKAYMIDRLDSAEARGMRSLLAKHLNCQSGFISQVLNGDRHFSSEHMIEIAEFFKLNAMETDFFMIMAHSDRAGSEHLKEYYRDRMQKMKISRQRLPLEVKTELTETEIVTFHSHWYYYAVYELTGLKIKLDEEQIAQMLDVSVARVKKALRFLLDVGVVIDDKGRYRKSDFNMAVGRKTPYINLIHRNFRFEAIRSLDRREMEDSHYSRFFTVSKKKAALLQEKIADFVKELNEEIGPAESQAAEVLYSFCLDCFRYGK